MRRTVRALLAAGWLALALSTSASAHAKFVRSEPAPDALLNAPPSHVTIWFSEELDTHTSTIKVLDARSAQVDLNNSQVNLDDRTQLSVGLQPLTDGAYRVQWHAVSADDKAETDGDFQFTLNRQATPAVPTPRAPTPPPTLPPGSTAVPPPTPGAATGVEPLLLLLIASVIVLGAGTVVALRRR